SSAYALAPRLFPSPVPSGAIEAYRLSEPVGYWNGLGLLVAMGALLALGFAVRGQAAVRFAAATALPVLLATVYFTFSRGAWGAFVVGLLAAFAVDPRRLQLAGSLLILAPASAATVLLAS